jgi:hypothetical protein
MSNSDRDLLLERQLRFLDQHWQAQLLQARASAVKLETEWQTQYRSRRQVVAVLAWLSPGTLLREAVTELAGTGAESSQSWEDAIEEYQTALEHSLFDDRPAATLRIPVGDTEFLYTHIRHQAPRFGDLPRFQGPEGSWRVRLSAAGIHLLGLIVWLIAATTAAWSLSFRSRRRVHDGAEI